MQSRRSSMPSMPHSCRVDILKSMSLSTLRGQLECAYNQWQRSGFFKTGTIYKNTCCGRNPHFSNHDYAFWSVPFK